MLEAQPSIPAGLVVFPANMSLGSDKCGVVGPDSCTVGEEAVPVGADAATKIPAFLKDMAASCGGTPTGTTMQYVNEYAGWTSTATNHYVLLLTDGVPTCDDGTECVGYGGCPECKNPNYAYESIEALAAKGIRTFVVGFDATAADCGTSSAGGKCGGSLPPKGPVTLNAATLNAMADKGGQALSGAKHYYEATDQASLAAALKAIIGSIAGTAGVCTKNPPVGGNGGPGGSGGGGSGGGGSGGGGSAGGDGGSGGKGNSSDGGSVDAGKSKPSPNDNVGCGCTTLGGRIGSSGLGLVLCSSAVVVALIRRRRRR